MRAPAAKPTRTNNIFSSIFFEIERARDAKSAMRLTNVVARTTLNRVSMSDDIEY